MLVRKRSRNRVYKRGCNRVCIQEVGIGILCIRENWGNLQLVVWYSNGFSNRYHVLNLKYAIYVAGISGWIDEICIVSKWNTMVLYTWYEIIFAY